MQDKKTNPNAGIGVTPEDRLSMRELREGLRSAAAAANLMGALVLLIAKDRPERHALTAAASNIYVAERDLKRALELVQYQESRWENDRPTDRITIPVPAKKKG